MKKLYSGLSHAVSSLESNNVGSTTTSTDPFFLKHKRKILTLIAGGLIGGCGGGSMDRENEVIPEVAGTSRMQKLSASIPITSVPTSAPFEVDGMIGYGWIYFEHPISGYASGPYINPFQSNSYNPRDILTKLGVTEWIIVRASFTYDADRDNDGKADSTWTPINSSMSMLVHRSVFERGEKIIFSPRSAFISESILSRSGKIISGGALDTIAREAGTDDTNQDGIIDYSDITSKKWSSGTTGTLSLPGYTSYMESVYKGNGVTRGNALKNLQKMQNHTIITIVPHPTNHDPVLKIETIGTSSILYTLDGSSPLPGAPNTIVAQSGVVIPLQDKRIYFRESIQNGAEVQLGKVKSFDLATDWMELSQQGQKYNTTGKETLDETSHAYNGKNYKVRSISNKTSPGFTYPKFLDCQVGPSTLDGCHLGPYVAYNEVHEAKIRELIHAAAQAHINTAVTTPPDTNPSTNPGTTPTTPTHYQNELINHTTKINYLGGWYHVQNQWNTSGTKDFPVTIIGMYATPDGIRQANITSIANNEAERLQFSQAMVGRLKGIIEAKLSNLPKPTYSQNYIIPSNPVAYKGYSYTLITTMNTTGYSDYPASVKVKYTTPNGPKETPVLPAKDPTELAKVQTERTNEAKSQIDMSLGLDDYAPYQVVTLTPRRYYSGGSYRTIFTYSGITGKDYPGYIDVIYRRSNGSTGKWTMEVMSETQRNLFVPQGEEQAKLEIDNLPLKGVNQIIKYANTPYGNKGGTYTRYEKYNRKGTGYNYPALIWYEYRATPNSPLLDTRNTYGVTEARNSEHLGELATTLESWVRGQMLAIGPIDSPNKYASITGSRILDIIVPSAHAADTLSSIVSKNNATKLTSLSPYSADVSFFRSYNIGNPVQDFFMKPGFTAPSGKSKVNVVGKSEEEVTDKVKQKEGDQIYSETQVELLNRINLIQSGYTCYSQGTSIDSCSDKSKVILPNLSSAISIGGQSFGTRIGDLLFSWNGTGKANLVFQELLLKYPENFLIMYALIIEEQSHLFLPVVEDYIPYGNSFGLSQIQMIPGNLDKQKFGYTASSKSDLVDPIKHLTIMNTRINQIKQVLKSEGVAVNSESIARTWNGGYNCLILNQNCDQRAINYGKRVSGYANSLLDYYNLYTKK
ncbi:hypothetical protein KBC86_02850 [Candidatus Gracilibacteria bacterium]|nr:hypothetical protein [Candidatus Gracilibacteria bacterium]